MYVKGFEMGINKHFKLTTINACIFNFQVNLLPKKNSNLNCLNILPMSRSECSPDQSLNKPINFWKKKNPNIPPQLQILNKTMHLFLF